MMCYHMSHDITDDFLLKFPTEMTQKLLWYISERDTHLIIIIPKRNGMLGSWLNGLLPSNVPRSVYITFVQKLDLWVNSASCLTNV